MSSNKVSYNDDELHTPEWLNAQFFTEVLRKHEKSADLKVLDVNMSPASVKGDHYASVMFRAGVDYSTTAKGKNSVSLIIKTMPELEGHKKDMLGESHIFETEIAMYSEVIPRFESILRAAGDDTQLGATCIYHSLKPRKVMIFEDLVPQGYTVIRNRSATLEELQQAFSKLAKWHAISFKLLKEEPEYFKNYKYGLSEMPGFVKDPMFNSGMKLFTEVLDKVPELKPYKPYFDKIKDTYLQRMLDVTKEHRQNPQPNGYYVLSHGDFHLRNMMFKHNKINGSSENCMLVDFQICNVCPITVDIIYSIYMLMSPEQRHENRDELLYYYFSTFQSTLQTIGYKGEMPSLVEFRRQMFEHRYFDFFLITTFLAMTMQLWCNNEGDINELILHEDARQKTFFKKDFIEDVKRILKRFLHQGYFE